MNTFQVYPNNAEDFWFAYNCYSHSIITIEELKEWIYLILEKNEDIPDLIIDMLEIHCEEDFRELNTAKIQLTTYNSNALYAVGYIRFNNFKGITAQKIKHFKQ